MRQHQCSRWVLASLLFALTVGGVLACGPKNQEPAALPEPPVETPPPADPVPENSGASQEELSTIPPPPPVRPEAEGWVEESPPPAPDPAARTTYGYRVQIFASATRDGAEEVAAEVRGTMQESVTIEYEAPFYKVRVGNCVTRNEAERLKEHAIQLGYEGPFITETTVEVR